jgi:hypothetical protein
VVVLSEIVAIGVRLNKVKLLLQLENLFTFHRSFVVEAKDVEHIIA